MILPPHSSHMSQPLDVGVFSALKKHIARELQPVFAMQISHLQKAEWLSAFVTAHHNAFRPGNIYGGFRGTGIHPFNPGKALHRIPLDETHVETSVTPTQRSPSLHSSTMTPFMDITLTNSPTALLAETHEFTSVISSDPSISTPVRNYINCLSRALKRSHAQNSILQHNLSENMDLVSKRESRQSGKRAIIKRKHLVTTEILDAVIATELETAAKKQKQSRKSTDTTNNESTIAAEPQYAIADELDPGMLVYNST